MLTVKHIDEDGREAVVSVERVSYDAKEFCLTGHGSNAAEIGRWSSGHAYVMNEQGKTVAVYSMGKK